MGTNEKPQILKEESSETIREHQVIINNIHHATNYNPQVQKWSPAVAGLLSFLIPGVGQMYKGKILVGIAWLIFTSIGYVLLLFPGILLHIICIVTATSGNPYEK
jgi:hypothetical protein